jgi:hypothetical protein
MAEEETINNLINSLISKVKNRINTTFVESDLVDSLKELKEKNKSKDFSLKDLTKLLKIYRNSFLKNN